MDIGTLVELIVARAKVDTTVPDPANPRSGWSTDALFQNVDALVVVRHNDPSGFVEIGQQVLAEVRDLPEMAILAQLAILRGERLLPEREEAVIQLSRELRDAILALPDGARKMRCRSLFWYHMGTFFEACQRFGLAAAVHQRAAEEADRLGDRPGAAISYFMMSFCLFRDEARSAATDFGRREGLFSEMEEKFDQLVEAVRGSPLEVQWGEGNGPLHMIEACSLLQRAHPRWDEWKASVIAASAKLGEAWQRVPEEVRRYDEAKRS